MRVVVTEFAMLESSAQVLFVEQKLPVSVFYVTQLSMISCPQSNFAAWWLMILHNYLPFGRLQPKIVGAKVWWRLLGILGHWPMVRISTGGRGQASTLSS